MLKLNLRELLTARGIKQQATFLKNAGISYPMASKFLNNRVSGISFQNITRICTALNCTPNDILIYLPSKKEVLPAGHSLKKLIPTHDSLNLVEELKTLPLDQINQIQDFVKGLKK